jgi:oxygen-independent coproporphyrinogen-3 oxidase
MLGLGAGARSYTRELHYSTPWKMLAPNIRGVIADYEQSWRAGDGLIRHGFVLDEDEQRRRFVILSLLESGLGLAAFRERFGAEALTLFAPQWDALQAEDCVTIEDDAVRLTPRGVRHSDVVGHLFFSERVCRLMETFEPDR